MEDLDNHILEELYDESKLNYLFQKNVSFSKKDTIKQLQRFVENTFINRENDVDNDEIDRFIDSNNNETYYSFFAEALLARLNINYIDRDLVIGVIAVNDNLTKISTGSDVCMFSDEYLVLGEAKFYGKLYNGVTKIIKDESFKSKLDDYIKNLLSSTTEITLKGITGDISEKTSDEIKKIPLILSGFVLHTKDSINKYESSYKLIDKVNIPNFPDHYQIHLYHLPIESKRDLIFKAQRKALDLIISLKTTK